MIYIDTIILETNGETATLKPIQAKHLDEALDKLYNQITSSQRATIK